MTDEIDSLDSALRSLRPRDEGGLSSGRPDSGREAPRLLNTFGGGLQYSKNNRLTRHIFERPLLLVVFQLTNASLVIEAIQARATFHNSLRSNLFFNIESIFTYKQSREKNNTGNNYSNKSQNDE